MKGALLIGIDSYPGQAQLFGCCKDAEDIAALLESNEDGSQNFQVVLQKEVQTKSDLERMIERLFHADLDTALFYFSGHGCITDRGGYIVTPDFGSYNEGISMEDLLIICNKSAIREKIIILDCCYSGAFGNVEITGGETAYLGSGITILTASGEIGESVERLGHGVFTSLLISALGGGAADLSGQITTGSIYAFIDRSLGFWDQRPQFKTNVSQFLPLRTVKPTVQVQEVLKKITEYFKIPTDTYPLDPSYEVTNLGVAKEENVSIFKVLHTLYGAGLVEPVGEEYMYWAAQNSKACRLTRAGKQYWQWVVDKKI